MYPHPVNPNFSSRWRGVLLCLAAFFSSSAYALSSDRTQPLSITANAGQLNQRTGVSLFQGHVLADQGSTHLTADTLVLQLDKNHQLQQGTAIGQLATYRTLPDGNKPEFHAVANTIKFYPFKALVILLGNATATQAQDSYAGPHIEYETKQQVVVSPNSQQGRTTIIIQPHSQETKPSP